MAKVLGKARTGDEFKIQEAYEKLDSRNKEKFIDYVRVLLMAQEREESLILKALKNRRNRAAVLTILQFAEMSREEMLFEVGELVINLPEDQIEKIIKDWEMKER